jgi:hypothetical protein
MLTGSMAMNYYVGHWANELGVLSLWRELKP